MAMWTWEMERTTATERVLVSPVLQMHAIRHCPPKALILSLGPGLSCRWVSPRQMDWRFRTLQPLFLPVRKEPLTSRSCLMQ